MFSLPTSITNKKDLRTLRELLADPKTLDEAEWVLRTMPRLTMDAAELVNELYLKWERLKRLTERRPQSFVRKSLLNFAVDRIRELNRSPEFQQSEHFEPKGSLESLLAIERRRLQRSVLATQLSKRLAALNEPQRQIADYAMRRLSARSRVHEMEVRAEYIVTHGYSPRTADRHFNIGRDILFELAESITDDFDLYDLFDPEDDD